MPKNKIIEPNLFKIGTMMKQDKFFVHIVKEGNNKIWKHMKPCKKYYVTLGNVGKPFFVRIFENTIDIYTNMNIEKYTELSGYPDLWAYYKTIDKYENVFVGKSPMTCMTKFSCGYGKQFDGNSILVKINSKMYMHIGECILVFSLENDEIIKYVSPVGNNDVPYPYAIGKKNTYLFIQGKYIDNKYLTKQDMKDPVDSYYGGCLDKTKFKKIKTKIIHDRLL